MSKQQQRRANFRHGDVYLFEVDSIPGSPAPAPKPVLAYGEVTGHRHQVFGDADVLLGEDGQLYVRTRGAATLEHVTGTRTPAEHHDIDLPAGKCFRVRIQEEYTPEGWRQVED